MWTEIGHAVGLMRTFARVGLQVVMITFLDVAPDAVRRHVLKAEYSGDALEARLNMQLSDGGFSMARALWYMARVQDNRLLSVGDMVPKNIELLFRHLAVWVCQKQGVATLKRLPSPAFYDAWRRGAPWC